MGQSETKSEHSQATSSGTRFWKWRKELIPGSDAETNGALQLVLLGLKNSGKSSAGNIILGREAFKTGTRTCQTETCKMGERGVTIVDTPGLTGKEASDKEVTKAIVKVCKDLPEMPVIFLVVVPLEWNMKKSQSYQQVLTRALNHISTDNMMVLITHAGEIQLEGTKLGLLQKGGLMQQTINRCGGWFHLFNIAETDQAKVSELLEKVDKMMAEGKKTREGQSVGTDMAETLVEDQAQDEGTDYTTISHLKKRVQKRVEVMKNSERIISVNKELLRKLRADIDVTEEKLQTTVAEDEKQALEEKIQELAKDIEAKEEKILSHIRVLQSLQQQVKEKQQHISEMEKDLRDRETVHRQRTEDDTSDTGSKSCSLENDSDKQMETQKGTDVTSGGLYSYKKNLQKVQEQIKTKRKEEEELVTKRNLDYKTQLQMIKAKIENNE